jgi:hypothetical protein
VADFLFIFDDLLYWLCSYQIYDNCIRVLLQLNPPEEPLNMSSGTSRSQKKGPAIRKHSVYHFFPVAWLFYTLHLIKLPWKIELFINFLHVWFYWNFRNWDVGEIAPTIIGLSVHTHGQYIGFLIVNYNVLHIDAETNTHPDSLLATLNSFIEFLFTPSLCPWPFKSPSWPAPKLSSWQKCCHFTSALYWRLPVPSLLRFNGILYFLRTRKTATINTWQSVQKIQDKYAFMVHEKKSLADFVAHHPPQTTWNWWPLHNFSAYCLTTWDTYAKNDYKKSKYYT